MIIPTSSSCCLFLCDKVTEPTIGCRDSVAKPKEKIAGGSGLWLRYVEIKPPKIDQTWNMMKARPSSTSSPVQDVAHSILRSLKTRSCACTVVFHPSWALQGVAAQKFHVGRGHRCRWVEGAGGTWLFVLLLFPPIKLYTTNNIYIYTY